MRKSILLFLALIISFTFTEVIKAEQEMLNPQFKSYWEARIHHEKLLEKYQKTGKKTPNWIRRWLWENRTEKLYQQNQDINSRTIDLEQQTISKNNSIQAQKGWSPLGPINLPKSYNPYSCFNMGRVNCIAFHPTNKNIMWCGAALGGIWKTEDHGITWIPLGDNLPMQGISHIVVNPKNPDILYAATGDWDGNGSPWQNFGSVGMIKSTDGGLSWNNTKLNKANFFRSGRPIKKIMMHPVNIDEIIVIGWEAVWKTRDGGETWKTVYNILYNSDIEMSPSDPNTLYLASNSYYNSSSVAAIRKSTDFGTTWRTLNTGAIKNNKDIMRMDIAIAPSDPNYIYVVAVDLYNYGMNSFHSSTDAGETWKEVLNWKKDSVNLLLSWTTTDSTKMDEGGQGHYNLTLNVDPKDKQKVYIGGLDVLVTTDGGSNWNPATSWVYLFGKSIHADQHYAEYNPLDSNYYYCNDGGIYRTKEIITFPRGWNLWQDWYTSSRLPGAPDYHYPTKWENITNGLAITQFYKMSLNKNTPNYITGGSQDNACYYYANGEWNNLNLGDGMETMTDHDNPKIVYTTWQNGGFSRSDDGGVTMKLALTDTITDGSYGSRIKGLGERGNWVTPISMDAKNSKLVYIGLVNLWKSRNKGDFWEKVTNFDTLMPPKGYAVSKSSMDLIKNSYNNSNYMCFATGGISFYDTLTFESNYDGYNLWIMKDGTNFKRSKGIKELDSGYNVQAIEYDAENPEIMWVVVNQKLYKTTDGGDSWTHIAKKYLGNYQIYSIALYQKSNRNSIFAATRNGVYYTNDRMDSWELYNLNMPMMLVTDVRIQEQTGKLYAATHGRGIWETDITDEINSVVGEDKAVYTFEVSPNPSSGSFAIQFKSANNLEQETELMLLDVLGRKVWSGKVPSNGNEINQNLNIEIENGVYYLRLISNGKEFAKKIIVKK